MKLVYTTAITLLALAIATSSLRASLINLQPPPKTNFRAAATLVLFNSRDPASAVLATYYAQKRQIPEEQVIGLDTSIEEEISRQEYDAAIAEPLKREFFKHGWWKLETSATGQIRVAENQIRFLALIRGIPLKIAATQDYQGDRPEGPAPFNKNNEASVDSELAALGLLTRVISGPQPNPYFRSFTPILDFGAPQLMLTARLDAPTSSLVRQMIDNALQSEAEGLFGFAYIDKRGLKDPGLQLGDRWLESAASSACKAGFPVIVDNGSELFPFSYPMKEVAFYYGWYSADACGPFARPEFQFNKGAIACHIHSFSAASVRDPLHGWAGPLLLRGATAVLGNVYEPYLICTHELGIFQERLRNSFTLAESAYSSLPFLSWMNTVIGDPLYRPFALWEDLGTPPQTAELWETYRKGAMLWAEKPGKGEAFLRAATAQYNSGLFLEALGLLQLEANDFRAAFRSFEQAADYYRTLEDKVRCAIHSAKIVQLHAPKEVCLKFVRQKLEAYPNSEASTILRSMETLLTTTPQTSPANKP